MAIFIHSSKFELITSRGTLITGGGATAFNNLALLLPGSGCCSWSSGATILILFRRLRFSAASSLMLTDLRGVRSDEKLASWSLYTSLRRFFGPCRAALGVVSESPSESERGWIRARREGGIGRRCSRWSSVKQRWRDCHVACNTVS